VIIPFCSWELEHGQYNSPTLWVKSDQSPFDKAGFLPVKYSGVLRETLFASYYEEEKARSYLDNLNLFYVALTRAEHGMIVMAPLPNPKRKKNARISDVLFESMQRTLPAGWEISNERWRSGEWSVNKESEEVTPTARPVPLKNYSTSTWRDKLVIKQSSRGHFESSENFDSEKIKYGIHLHTVFSRIKYHQDLDEVINKIEQEGIITLLEKPVIHTLLEELLSNEIIAGWFSSEWDVRTEVPILLPGDGDNRIDRLMIKDKKAVVVDFKTGEPSRSDQQQVSSYIDTLRQMNFTEVEGYLLYIKTGEVISVPPGKKTRAKEDKKGQLGFGF
jgi:ATP-dependent exoDNAse (exonuclease V) beta subunit